MYLIRCFALFHICRLGLSTYDISDDKLYKVKWNFNKEVHEPHTAGHNILISTNLGEKFECVVPVTVDLPEPTNHDANSTANEEVLLQKLFEARPCSTRTEFYWSYELCHKNYVRQFHEELLPDKSSKTQEYFLGYFKRDNPSGTSPSSTRPGLLLGGSSYPYYAVEFVDGTPCDLTGAHRSTSVLYICLEEEEGRIIQVSETESCQYQVVFATRHLCPHPAYRLPKRPVKPLSCSPREGSSAKPTALIELEKEQKHLSQNGVSNLAALFGDIALKNIRVEANRKNNMIIYHIRTVDPDEDDAADEEVTDEDEDKTESTESSTSRDVSEQSVASKVSQAKPKLPDQAYRTRFLEFIAGKFCLQGRTPGWWQYEICMRNNVTQYHTNNQGRRTQVIVLGRWDFVIHDQWREKRVHNLISRIRSATEGLDLFYGNGDFCESVGKAREVIVKLRCNAAATGIHLSFFERSECLYTALVESSVFCEFSPKDIESLVY